MEIKWLVWLNFIILSETFVVANLIFAKTKHIQKKRERNRTLWSSTLLGASVEAHPNFGGQREAS